MAFSVLEVDVQNDDLDSQVAENFVAEVAETFALNDVAGLFPWARLILVQEGLAKDLDLLSMALELKDWDKTF